MLSSRYLISLKNLPAILQKIVDGAPPDIFNLEHLEGLGFTSSTDRSVIPLLKDLGFLTPDGRPTQRYRDYRDKSRSKRIMSEALREAYGDLFHINENLSKSDRDAIVGKFKSVHGTTDIVAERQAGTFLALADLADLQNKPGDAPAIKAPEVKPDDHVDRGAGGRTKSRDVSLNYRIEIHLPPTKDIEIYNSIFKSLKEHLLNE